MTAALLDARTALLSAIRDHAVLGPLLEFVTREMTDDPGHDIDHALRVARWCIHIGRTIDVPWEEAAAAALLHDIVNVPKDSPQRKRASELSADRAGEVLTSLGWSTEARDAICAAIADHSYSRDVIPRSALGCALQDADRLDALGALGIMRTVSTGVLLGGRYFDPDDPWAARRPMDDRRFTLDHFFTKLLKLPDTMRTDAGRKEAHTRAQTMRQFLHALGEEIGVQLPQTPLRAGAREPMESQEGSGSAHEDVSGDSP